MTVNFFLLSPANYRVRGKAPDEGRGCDNVPAGQAYRTPQEWRQMNMEKWWDNDLRLERLWGPGALSLGVKRPPGHEADHSHPSSAGVKEYVELYLHSPNPPSWRGAQLKKAHGELYLYL
jgi:hypothetical protein